MIKGKESIQEPENPSKRAKEDSIPDEEKNHNKKHLHGLKIRETTLVILIRRRVNPMIIQVKILALLGTWANNIKIKKMKNTVKLLLR